MIGGTFVRLGCGDNPTITSYDDDVILQPRQRVFVVLEKEFVLEREREAVEREAVVIWMHVFQYVRLCDYSYKSITIIIKITL